MRVGLEQILAPYLGERGGWTVLAGAPAQLERPHLVLVGHDGAFALADDEPLGSRRGVLISTGPGLASMLSAAQPGQTLLVALSGRPSSRGMVMADLALRIRTGGRRGLVVCELKSRFGGPAMPERLLGAGDVPEPPARRQSLGQVLASRRRGRTRDC